MAIFSEFNNRELAIIIWIIIFSTWAILKEKVRSASVSLIKAFFEKKLVIGYLLMLLYISLILFFLYLAGIWDLSWIKNTLLWIICVAFVMLLQVPKANSEKFFKNTLKDNFRILVVLEFIINLYVFHLLIEMIMVPFSALIGGMLAISESDAKYNDVKKVLNFLLMFLGIIFISNAIYMITSDFSNFVSKKNLVDLFLPILLTIMFIPFIYLKALFSSYESLFLRMPFFIKNQNVLIYSTISVKSTFNL